MRKPDQPYLDQLETDLLEPLFRVVSKPFLAEEKDVVDLLKAVSERLRHKVMSQPLSEDAVISEANYRNMAKRLIELEQSQPLWSDFFSVLSEEKRSHPFMPHRFPLGEYQASKFQYIFIALLGIDCDLIIVSREIVKLLGKEETEELEQAVMAKVHKYNHILDLEEQLAHTVYNSQKDRYDKRLSQIEAMKGGINYIGGNVMVAFDDFYDKDGYREQYGKRGNPRKINLGACLKTAWKNQCDSFLGGAE